METLTRDFKAVWIGMKYSRRLCFNICACMTMDQKEWTKNFCLPVLFFGSEKHVKLFTSKIGSRKMWWFEEAYWTESWTLWRIEQNKHEELLCIKSEPWILIMYSGNTAHHNYYMYIFSTAHEQLKRLGVFAKHPETTRLQYNNGWWTTERC